MNTITETIRTSFFPNDRFSGTKLFLNLHTDGWFWVESRFQTYKKSRDINTALQMFEDTLNG